MTKIDKNRIRFANTPATSPETGEKTIDDVLAELEVGKSIISVRIVTAPPTLTYSRNLKTCKISEPVATDVLGIYNGKKGQRPALSQMKLVYDDKATWLSDRDIISNYYGDITHISVFNKTIDNYLISYFRPLNMVKSSELDIGEAVIVAGRRGKTYIKTEIRPGYFAGKTKDGKILVSNVKIQNEQKNNLRGTEYLPSDLIRIIRLGKPTVYKIS